MKNFKHQGLLLGGSQRETALQKEMQKTNWYRNMNSSEIYSIHNPLRSFPKINNQGKIIPHPPMLTQSRSTVHCMHIKHDSDSKTPNSTFCKHICTTSTNVQTMYSLMIKQCPVCWSKYGAEEPDRRPMIMDKCGHSICQACGITLENSTRKCPECRIRFQALTTNWTVLRMLGGTNPVGEHSCFLIC